MGNFETERTSAFSDDSHEIKSAMAYLGIAHSTSTPGQPQANGRAERNGKHILEGTRAILARSGVPIKLWPLAARYFSLMSNVVPREKQELKDTPWVKRHGTEFQGRLIPFGSYLRFIPIKEEKTHEKEKRMTDDDKEHARVKIAKTDTRTVDVLIMFSIDNFI